MLDGQPECQSEGCSAVRGFVPRALRTTQELCHGSKRSCTEGDAARIIEGTEDSRGQRASTRSRTSQRTYGQYKGKRDSTWESPA